MRVLVVDEEIPFPLNSGKRIRTYNLLKHLSGRHEITFVCRQHAETEDLDSEALETIGIRPITVPHLIRKKIGLKFCFALLVNLFSKYPYSVTSHYSDRLVDTLKRILNQNQFDLIHCEWTPYAINLQPFFPYPAVVDAHNVEAMIWQRNYEVEKNLLKKYYILLQWKKMARFEKAVFQQFSNILAVSEPDKSIISKWVSKDNIDVVPNGVDVDYFKSTGKSAVSHSVVFTGSLDWRPNINCVLYFLDEIWPLVLSKFADATVTIVGRRPMQILKSRVSEIPSAKLTGTVDDVRPYIEQASVYIVPLRIGGGTRLKILEALAMQKPVISTSVGAEGLDVTDGRNIIIADDPDEFSQKIMLLFQDLSLCKRMGEAGRHLVESQYQWKVLADRLEQVWLQACKKNGQLN